MIVHAHQEARRSITFRVLDGLHDGPTRDFAETSPAMGKARCPRHIRLAWRPPPVHRGCKGVATAGVEPVLAGAGLYWEKAEAEGIAFCEVRPSDAGL